MPRGPRPEPLRLEDAPETLDAPLIARVMGIGVDYARQLLREGYLVNIGGAKTNRRTPKLAVAILLEKVAKGEVVLPERERSRQYRERKAASS